MAAKPTWDDLARHTRRTSAGVVVDMPAPQPERIPPARATLPGAGPNGAEMEPPGRYTTEQLQAERLNLIERLDNGNDRLGGFSVAGNSAARSQLGDEKFMTFEDFWVKLLTRYVDVVDELHKRGICEPEEAPGAAPYAVVAQRITHAEIVAEDF